MKKRISEHQRRVYFLLKTKSDAWLTSKEIADSANVSWRCARFYAKYFSDNGVVKCRQEFPEFKYRFVNVDKEMEAFRYDK